MRSQCAPADVERGREGDSWVATHVATEVASQGNTPNEAVARAEEAPRLHRGCHEAGKETVQREMLDRFDSDPDDGDEPIAAPDGLPESAVGVAATTCVSPER